MKISNGTIIRTIVLAVALLNQILTVFGFNPLPFSDEEIYAGLSAVATVITALVAWWKNNSFTKPAIEADKYMKTLKNTEE